MKVKIKVTAAKKEDRAVKIACTMGYSAIIIIIIIFFFCTPGSKDPGG